MKLQIIVVIIEILGNKESNLLLIPLKISCLDWDNLQIYATDLFSDITEDIRYHEVWFQHNRCSVYRVT